MPNREDQVVTRLRALIFVIIGLGVVAGVLGSSEVRFFVICFYLPAGWAYVRPRWPQITIWIMWATTWGMLAVILALGGKPELLEAPSHWLMAGAAFLLCVVVPLVRRMHEAPPLPLRGSSRIPEARIHVRD